MKNYKINYLIKDNKDKSVKNNQQIFDIEITDAIEKLENVNSYSNSIEALIERIFNIKLSKNMTVKFQEISEYLAPKSLKIHISILNNKFHQTVDCLIGINLTSYFFNITCNFNWHR